MTSWIERQIEPRLERLAATRPVIVLTGARQTGKTALCRHLFPDHHYVSLDLPSEAASAEQDPVGFLERHPLPLLIDEVQYAPGLFRHLKVVVDAHRQRCGQIVLTGSQPFVLMRNVSESLAGRAAVLSLDGLGLAEIVSVAPEASVPEILLRGSFPELWSRPEIDASDFHRSYATTYLERDLRSLQQVGNLQQFERFLRASALRSGQLLNRAELARDVGIAPSTAGLWLSVLERSGLVFLLEPWFGNAGKRLSRSPKLYWADTGLLCWLIGINQRSELIRFPWVGAIWETFVVAELRRQLNLCSGAARLHFWRDRSKEVDLLLERGGRFWVGDAKWSELPSASDARRLHQVAAELPEGSVEARSLVCRSSHRFPLGNGADAVPLAELAASWGLDQRRSSTATGAGVSPPELGSSLESSAEP